MAQFAEIEAEAAFEQDQRNADADHRLEQRTEGLFRVEQPEHGPGEEAGGEHQHDRRPAGPPRNPLRADTQRADRGDHQC